VAEAPSYSTHVRASPYRRRGRKVAQLVEVGGDPKPLGRPLVLVRQRVGDERAGAGGDAGQDEGVRSQRRPDHRRVGLLRSTAIRIRVGGRVSMTAAPTSEPSRGARTWRTRRSRPRSTVSMLTNSIRVGGTGPPYSSMTRRIKNHLGLAFEDQEQRGLGWQSPACKHLVKCGTVREEAIF
jgi:hypothetical protein